MPGADDGLGKKAEAKLKEWLDRPDDGYSFDRIPDQMTGFYGSKNICDFICFKSPNLYYIESKSTWHDRFDFSAITEIQFNGLLKKSKIDGAYGLVVVLFGTYQRAFILNIADIAECLENNVKSINIKKIDKWKIPFAEISTLPSRKQLLDYTGELPQYVANLVESKTSINNH